MDNDNRLRKLERTQSLYNNLMVRVNSLCEEARTELKKINGEG
jgi:hypothetical protein